MGKKSDEAAARAAALKRNRVFVDSLFADDAAVPFPCPGCGSGWRARLPLASGGESKMLATLRARLTPEMQKDPRTYIAHCDVDDDGCDRVSVVAPVDPPRKEGQALAVAFEVAIVGGEVFDSLHAALPTK